LSETTENVVNGKLRYVRTYIYIVRHMRHQNVVQAHNYVKWEMGGVKSKLFGSVANGNGTINEL